MLAFACADAVIFDRDTLCEPPFAVKVKIDIVLYILQGNDDDSPEIFD